MESYSKMQFYRCLRNEVGDVVVLQGGVQSLKTKECAKEKLVEDHPYEPKTIKTGFLEFYEVLYMFSYFGTEHQIQNPFKHAGVEHLKAILLPRYKDFPE